MTPREFLTDWIVKYAKTNYDNLDITYDDAYGFNDNRWGNSPKVKLSKLVKDLKEDFGMVEWFLLEVLWWDETIIKEIRENDNPVFLYDLDGTFIKATPVNNPTGAFYREWVWEYYIPVSDSWDNILQHYRDEKAETLTVDNLIKFLKDNYNVPTIKK